jgi:flagellar biogenesis protein FliO
MSRRLFAAILLVSTFVVQPGAYAAADVSARAPAAESIPYRKAEGGDGAVLVRVIAGLAVVLVVGVAAIFLLRRYFPVAYGHAKDGSRKIQLLETRRLTPRTTLFAVQFEGRRLLLAQSGDRITRVCQINEHAAQNNPTDDDAGQS